MSTAHAGPNEVIAVAIAGCEHGVATACLEAATALDEIHVVSRTGHTPRELRDRALALRDERCAAGEADSCYEHGRLLVRAHDARATSRFERACALGSGEACLYLGTHGSPANAKAMFERACDGGSAHGCELLAHRVDARRAVELHRKACAGDDALACVHSGDERRAAGDRAGAFGDFDKACELSDLASCDAAGTLAADAMRARELFGRACDAKIGAGCGHLGELVARGDGGERNWGRGIELAEQGCKLDKDARCARAATLRAHPPDWHCATEAACERACDEQIGRSCRALGELRTDPGFAYDRGCRAGDAASCLRAGNAEVSIAAAADHYARGCKLGDAAACMYAHYASGNVDVLARTCPRVREACVLLGLTIEERQPGRARELWRDACAHGHGAACRYAAHQLFSPHGSGTCDCDMHAPTRAELAEEARRKQRYDDSQKLLKLGCEAGDSISCDEAGGAPPVRVSTTPAWE